MTTLIDTTKPSEDYLSGYLNEALQGRTENDYVAQYLSNFGKQLILEPRAYRTLGPYWPSFKALMLSQGIGGLSDEFDEDVKAIYDYSRPALTVLAGALYANQRFTDGNVYSANHRLIVNPDSGDEDYNYYSNDLLLESRIAAR